MVEQAEQSTQHENADERQSAVGQFADDVAGALLAPVVTLRRIGVRQAVVPAMMLVVLITVVGSSGQVATLLLTFAQLLGLGPDVVAIGAGSLAAVQISTFIGNLIWAPVLWTISSGIVYAVARMLGGRGNFMALWAATGFALAPQLLVAPFSSASDVLNWVGAGWQLFGWLLVFPLTIAALVWTLVLYVIAVRETMALSTGQSVTAIALVIAATVLLLVLIICMLLFFIVGIVALIAA